LKNRMAFLSGVVLLVITLLAAALRLYRLDAQSLWYDEGFSVYLARMSPSELTARTAADIQPPLYYYLLHGWMGLFGDGERSVRSLSLLFGVLTVPVLYGTAAWLFRSRLAGYLAALLLAVSPLHLWYAQEVRMYTLLTFLCLLSSFFLLLLVGRSTSFLRKRSRFSLVWEILLWVGFSLANVAALYTHYFALFVVGFQAAYLVAVLIARRFRPLSFAVGAAASGLVTLVSYLPWLPNLFTRYGADASYWPGQLKLNEVLVDIAVFVVGGESLPERLGLTLAMGVGAVLALSLAVLFGLGSLRVLLRRRSRRVTARRGLRSRIPFPLLFLLLYLVLPPALILLLSYNAPKFNPRYVMVSHPALLLLLAGGLALLWERRSGCASNLLRWVLVPPSLLFLFGTAAYADYRIYAAPDVARADVRGAARYVRAHMEPEESVILCAGHSYPIYDYYASGMPRLLMPDSPTLDTTQTLDYSIADDLNRWLVGRSGVWLVLWQDEVVDPIGYLPAMLAAVGEEVEVPQTFSQVRLRHFRLPAGVSFSSQPDVAHPARHNFGDQIRLLGYNQTGPSQVTLFWEALRPLKEDYLVSLVLRDTLGQAWGSWDGRPAAYLYPTMRWRVGQVVFGRYDLAPIPGTPPGDYGLYAGVYTEADPVGLDVLNEAGAAQGKRAMLGAVRLSVPAAEPGQLDIPRPLQADMGGGLALLGWDLSRPEGQPGDRLILSLIWSVKSEPAGDYRVALFVADAGGRLLPAGTFPPTNVWHPTGVWLPGQAWRGQNTFRLPVQAQPGQADLSVQLVDEAGAALGAPVVLGSLQVQPTARVFTPPEPQVPRPADYGGRIGLVGADLSPDPVGPGGTLQVTLYWQALVDMDVPYTVFVHLLGVDGQVAAGHDGEPVAATRPTTGWVPGEYVVDTHDVQIPVDMAQGDYVVEVGLYDAGTRGMPRLRLVVDGGITEADRVVFGPVQVR